MAQINVSEDDFTALADAANDAQSRGDTDAAKALDKLARKTNAALANSAGGKRRFSGGPSVGGMKWTQVPSCLL